MNLYEKALKIAIDAHEGQKRKHDGSAYIAHPIMVSRIIEAAGFPEASVVAGLVHDVLEDTIVPESILRSTLGDVVVDIVLAVSEDKALEWEERKEAYVKQVLWSDESVWIVSLADKIHNADDFIDFYSTDGAHAWTVFNRGKDKKIWFEEFLHAELSKVWQHPLLDVYAARIATLKTLAE